MKILKRGKDIDTRKYFMCKKCDCIFEADENEYKSASLSRNEIIFSCICPMENCKGLGYELTEREAKEYLND